MTRENDLSFFRRFLIYQKERFPFIAHGLMISCFTFSAISYSRICRKQEGFIDLKDFLIGIFATITLFLLVRIFDEFKDKEDDAKFRKYLPVPRGLVSLKELRSVGLVVGLIQVAVIAIFQYEMLYLYGIVLGYLFLMGVEFFIPHWLKRHQIAYITSHMVIIPLIDIYSSGLDWRLEGSEPHWGLAWFFAVSFCNGLVLEFGRKIRTPEKEEEGVVSYTKLYGTKGGVIVWLILLLFTFCLALGAGWYAGFLTKLILVLSPFLILCSLPAILFVLKPTVKRSKFIEYSSALWTALMYLSLGGVPMLIELLR